MKITKNFKIVRKQIDSPVKAAAMEDETGRVLVVISDELPLPQIGMYTAWGLYKYMRFRLAV